MNDFDRHLEARLRRLEAAIPQASPEFGSVAANPAAQAVDGRARMRTRIPIGMVAVVTLLAVALLTLGLLRGNGGPAGGPSGSPGMSQAQASGPSPSAGSSSPASGMVLGSAVGYLIAGQADQAYVELSITNETGQDDKLVGLTSTAAGSVAIFAIPACSAVPSGEGGACSTPWTIPWIAIAAGETVEVNTIALSGFAVPPSVGDVVPVTLDFALALPVTVQVTIVGQPGPSEAPARSGEAKPSPRLP